MLCKAPNGKEFYMAGERMWSCFGYNKTVENDAVVGYKAAGYKEYSDWRKMADDMEAGGIKNIFAPFARDWG